jgi:hypothetical protein
LQQTYDVVLRDGRVTDPESGFDAFRSVGIIGKTIAAISSGPLRGTTDIDATGPIVAPGGVDAVLSKNERRAQLTQARLSEADIQAAIEVVQTWATGLMGQFIVCGVLGSRWRDNSVCPAGDKH